MNQSANKAFRHFAGNRSLQDTPVEKLKTLAEGYPYFPVAQFFLAKKLNESDDDNYAFQSQKAALYFSNPFLFDYLLHADMDALISDEDEPIVTESVTEKATDQQNPAATSEPVNTIVESAQELAVAQIVITNEPFSFLAEVTEVFTEPHITLPKKEIGDKAEEPDEHEKMFRSIKAMLDATSEETEHDVLNTDIQIDPYYTIDYFASQGIKLNLEINPQDKLGQNLKRFTQWLRHMKKLGPEDAKNEMEHTDLETTVQQMADSSNHVKEVVTEAMAAVLEKQGKKEKAIELYRKLSFLNPDKSAFFAAKIDNLKSF